MVVGPHAVDAQHCRSGVGSGRRLHCADDGLGACTCAKRVNCLRPGKQAPKEVAHDHQRNHAAQSHASATSLGIFAPASLSAACPRSSAVVSPSMRTLRYSFVHPDRPAAAPRRAWLAGPLCRPEPAQPPEGQSLRGGVPAHPAVGARGLGVLGAFRRWQVLRVGP